MISFEHISPEEAGISSKHILRFLERLEQKQVPMHSIQFLWRDKLLAEGYYRPYSASTPHRMFSVTKSLVSIAIGFLEQEGKLSLADPIVRYFPDLVPEKVHPWIAEMTICDMLMMRTCHASTTYKLDMKKDWVESFFTTPPTHPAGRIFHYDTSSAHTLCALVERLSGMPFLDFLKDRLDVLELSDACHMLTDPFGVSLGGSGLVCLPEDLRKIAYFIEHFGKVNGRQILREEYLRTATSHLTSTRMTAPLPSEACGYGYQFWQNERGGYTCYGMGGQLIIFLPEQEFICITTADTQGLAGGNQLIYDALYEEIVPYLPAKSGFASPIPRDPEISDALTKKLASLSLLPLKPSPGAADSTPRDCHFCTGTWEFAENPQGFSHMELQFAGTEGSLCFRIHGKAYPLSFGMGHLCTGVFPVYSQQYAASGIWEDTSTLYLRFHIIDDYVGSVHMQLHFDRDFAVVFLKKQEESLFQEFHGHLTAVRVS